MWFMAALFVIDVGCARPEEARDADVGPPVVAEQRIPNIDHVAPARDSVGPRPTRFEWTAATDADGYAIGVWNDVDRLMWRQDRVQGTSVTFPKDIELEFGTYFWQVTALRDGRAIAETGRSAFVVMP